MAILKKNHVASGSFEVGTTQPRLLQAFLGTCVGVAVFDAENTHVKGSSPALSDVKQAIETIRPIPQVALKVMRIVEEDAYDIDKVAGEVKKDQVIGARTIRLCNSALFTKRHDVISLDHALVFLGQERFIKLVISAAVQSYYNQCGNGYSLCKGGLYHHAIGTAMIAEKIARMTEKASSSAAYTAGLLHDIGKVVLDQYITGADPMLYREFQGRQSEIIDVEIRVLGMDHTRVGELLARNWSLPAALTDAIRFHHQPEASLNNVPLTTIVYLADLLMSRFHSGLELARMGTDSLTDHLSQRDLSTSQFYDLVDLIPGTIFEPVMETTEPPSHG
jgi:putative nucleotidyltransferase with HDIG domain